VTIDLSQLSPEKRAFLKVNPELLQDLEKEIPNQVRQAQDRQEKLRRGKSKWQRDLEDVVEEAKQQADELRREYDPELRRINRLFMEKAVRSDGALVCPVCGGSDHGNKMDGKPWCFKCNSPLESAKTANKRFPSVKVLPKSKRLETTFRRLDE